MALNHNIKQTLIEISQGRILKDYQIANTLSSFYTHKSNINEEDCIKFAQEKKIDPEIVIKYINERKKLDEVNNNILSLKFGMKYTRPEEKLLKEFDTRSKEPDFVILNENVPKKVKKVEFQVVNEENSKNTNHATEKTHSKSSQGSKSTSNEVSIKLENAKDIQNLISQMKKENKIENRLKISIALKKLDSSYLLDKFVQLNGNQVLGYWFEDYKEEIEANGKIEEKVKEILTNLLSFCNNLPISVHELKSSKIGKKINKLGKCVENKIIKQKCEELVSRWKKLIEKIKDKKHSKDSKEHRSSKEKDSYEQHKNPSSSRSRSNSQEMLRKTKRESRDYSPPSIIPMLEEEKNNKKPRLEENTPIPKEDKNYISSNPINIVNANPKIIASNINQTFAYSNVKPEVVPGVQFINYNPNMMKNPIGNMSNVATPSMNSNSLNTQTKSSLKKSILKKTEPGKKNEKKVGKVKWESDMRMEKVKIFKSTDEPSANEVSEEEYRRIQMELLKNPDHVYLKDIRLKEIRLEKENMSKAREKSKQAKEILTRMIPQMSWRRPYELKVSSVETEVDDYPTFKIRGRESEEKQMVDILCQKILSVTYFRESEIPDSPKVGAYQLFCFTNEDIPKIENWKKVYNYEKPNPNAEILEQIGKTYEITPSPEFIKLLITKLQEKEFTSEESTKIMDYLSKHSGKGIKKINLDASNNPTKQMNMNMVPFNNFNLNMNNPINLNSVNIPSLPINSSNISSNNTNGGNSANLNNLPIPPYNVMPMNFALFNKRPPNLKYKTRPCNNFHGPNGCTRSDNCHFIHDSTYAGREIPNFNYLNYNHSDKRAEENTEDKTKAEKNMINMIRPPFPMPMQMRPPFIPQQYPGNPFMFNFMRGPNMNMPTNMNGGNPGESDASTK